MNKLWIGVLMLFIFSSCGSEPLESKRLNDYERKQADSLFFMIKPKFEKDLDSLCELRIDSLFPALIDSIKAQRLLEIEKILNQ